jgi:hypothetical protein
MNQFFNTQAERVKRVLNATFLQSSSANREPAGETASAAEPQAEEPATAETDSRQKTSKLTYLQAQFKKYACSFKSRIYSGQNRVLMSEEEEAKATRFAIELFFCLTMFLSPALRDFLASKNVHPKNSIIDGYEYLKKMLKICKKNINFLSPGGGNGLDLQYVQTAHKGRNCVCHGDLKAILAEWHKFLHAWIEVCYLINAPEAARQIKLVHDRLIAEEERNNTENQPIPVTASIENVPDDKGKPEAP